MATKLFDNALKAIERIVNMAIIHMQLPELNSIENQTIEVYLTPLKKSIYITLLNNEILLGSNTLMAPVTKISGYPSAFLKVLLSKEKNIPKDIQIEGNMHHMLTLNKIIHSLEIDWEEVLSQFIGDAPAYFVGESVRHLQNWLQDTMGVLKINTQEYLVDEIKIMPSTFELNQFFENVDELRDRTERLIKKIEKLENVL